MNRLGDDVMIEIVERIFHIVSFIAAFDLLHSLNKGCGVVFTKDFLDKEARLLRGLFISCTLFAFYSMKSTGSLVAYSHSIRFLMCLLIVTGMLIYLKTQKTQLIQCNCLEENQNTGNYGIIFRFKILILLSLVLPGILYVYLNALTYN